MISANKILEDAKSFPAPQDLRFTVFACQAVLQYSSIVQQHLSELRKNCLLTVTDPFHIKISTPRGVEAHISLHYCYPQVISVILVAIYPYLNINFFILF
jgi:hypothetical protein